MKNNRLFELREYNNLTQKDVAEVLGLKRRTYTSWEIGTITIPLKHLNSLSDYYNVSMDYLLGLSTDKDFSKNNYIKKLNKKEIGKRINQVRKANNLTLRDLAKELNTTYSTINAYELGKTLILTAFAYQICKKYKISLDWLCGKIK